MTGSVFKTNEVVWAKSDSFPWWPAVICSPSELLFISHAKPRRTKSDQILVRFLADGYFKYLPPTKLCIRKWREPPKCVSSPPSKFRIDVADAVKAANAWYD